jgi:hypothetical protein
VDFQGHNITVGVAYVKNGKSRSVPLNAVLTETLKIIRMNVSAASWLVVRGIGLPTVQALLGTKRLP